MATIATYNGVEIHNCLIKRFDQEVQYDDTHTDAIFSRFTFTIEGLIHGMTNGLLLPTGISSPVWTAAIGTDGILPPAVQLYNQISNALSTPRCIFRITMGGAQVFLCNPPSATLSDPYGDLDNGPKPTHVELSNITAPNFIGPTFRVSFTIECAQATCGATGSGGTQPPALSNRWAISETLDDECFTMRTVHGVVRLANTAVQPDSAVLRMLCVPPLEKGFRRDRLDWNIDETGLKITYVVTDKQIHTSAPWPAVKLQVQHSEGTGDGGNFESECHVMLKGHPGADKLALFILAFRIIEDRLGQVKNYPSDNTTTVKALMMTDHIGERNEIDVYMKVNHSIGWWKDQIQPSNFLATPIGRLGRPLTIYGQGTPVLPATWAKSYPQTYDPTLSQFPWPFGYNPTVDANHTGVGDQWRQSFISSFFLQCFLQSPCNNTHWMPKVTPTPAGTGTLPQITSPSAYKSPPGPSPGGGSTSGPPAGSTAENPPPPATPTQVTLNNNIPSFPEQAQTLANPTKQVFTHAAVQTILNVQPNRVQLPIGMNPAIYAAGGNTCVIGTLGLPTAQMTFLIEAECVGQYPGIPVPVPVWATNAASPIQGALMDAMIEPLPPVMDPTSAKLIYHVTCKYIYALSRAPQATDIIPIGVLPQSSFNPNQTGIALAALFNDPSQNTFGGSISTGQQNNNGHQQNNGNWKVAPASGNTAKTTATTNW